jgi:hypothetical protein
VSQTLSQKAAGLWLTSNPFEAPQGALILADNSVIRRQGVIEPRRGQKPDTEVDDTITALNSFEGSRTPER